MPGWLPHQSGVCRARRDPGQHSASACCPQPAGKAVGRLKNVKLCLKQPPWGLPAQQAPLPSLEGPQSTGHRQGLLVLQLSGVLGQPQPHRAGRRCPRWECHHALQDGATRTGDPVPSVGSVGPGLGFDCHTSCTKRRGFPGKPMQSAFTRW